MKRPNYLTARTCLFQEATKDQTHHHFSSDD